MKAASMSVLIASALAAASATAHGAPLGENDVAAITESVDRSAPRLTALARDIWTYAEPGFQETRSAARIQADLKAAGFRIEAGVAKLPTAFIASAGTGGPVIALIAEYDALPGLSQSAAASRQAVPGQTAGHACGHNLVGTAAVGAAIALKAWLAESGVPGTVRLYGTPAEEGGFAKVLLARDGLFDDVDATLNFHPSDQNSAWQVELLSIVTGKFRFTGTPAHASAAPERGRSALDGVELLNVAANFMREHLPQETRIHYVISDGGAQPSIVPATAEAFYYVRHPKPEVAREIWKRLEMAAAGAAMASETSVSTELISGAYGTLPNITLGRIADMYLRKVGGFSYTPDEASYAARLSDTLPSGARVGKGDPALIEPFVEGVKISASSDLGDVSWVSPTVQIGTATWVAGTPPHSWQAVTASGSSIGMKGAIMAAKALALTAADLFRNPASLAAARAEFDRRRGAGFQYRALIDDQTSEAAPR